MKTNLCHVLGIEHPIIAAPMGPDMTGPELVAAVSNAGGLGILQAQFRTPPVFRQEIRRVPALTARPFGVNLLLRFPVEDQVAIRLGERVPILADETGSVIVGVLDDVLEEAGLCFIGGAPWGDRNCP
jgi:nitronate monooxygenase